jgi:hypothetical protein
MKLWGNIIRIFVFVLLLAGGVLIFIAGNIYMIPKAGYLLFQAKLKEHEVADSVQVDLVELRKIRLQDERLRRKINRLTPGSAFLIVNTTNNTFRLFKNKQLVRKGLCSTGSFIRLELDSSKNWTFETPKGVLTVRNKIVNPVWRKPDWAFIEEGLPVPPANDPSRFECGVLGDYALNLGEGYLIHGTLYQRLLGMPVTHGCIRLSDDDLLEVYKTLQVGSKVFIY